MKCGEFRLETDRVKKATQLAFDSRIGPSAALYWLEGRGKDLSVIMDNEWVLFLHQNIGMISMIFLIIISLIIFNLESKRSSYYS
jgi:hypothetical protein